MQGRFRWIENLRCDFIVTSWIQNSNSVKLAEALIYNTSVKELWNEIEEWYRESNGSLIFQIQKKISSIMKDNVCVTFYQA